MLRRSKIISGEIGTNILKSDKDRKLPESKFIQDHCS